MATSTSYKIKSQNLKESKYTNGNMKINNRP